MSALQWSEDVRWSLTDSTKNMTITLWSIKTTESPLPRLSIEPPLRLLKILKFLKPSIDDVKFQIIIWQARSIRFAWCKFAWRASISPTCGTVALFCVYVEVAGSARKCLLCIARLNQTRFRAGGVQNTSGSHQSTAGSSCVFWNERREDVVCGSTRTWSPGQQQSNISVERSEYYDVQHRKEVFRYVLNIYAAYIHMHSFSLSRVLWILNGVDHGHSQTQGSRATKPIYCFHFIS